MKIKFKSVLYSLTVILFLCFGSFAQAPKTKGKYTKEIKEPVNAHILNEIDMGKVKRIRGKLYIGDHDIPINSIISVYKISNDKSEFLFSYLVGANGKFDFKKLKKGIYLLMTGTTDASFNQNNVKVILAPQDDDSSDEDLQIPMEVGT